MDEQDELLNKSTATNVQMHELKPAAEGLSFGALLDKFYMSFEATKHSSDNSVTKAQDFISKGKKSDK